MKKVLMILLALAMVFSMAGVASADDTTDITGNSGSTEVTYNTEQGYIVTIPTKVAFAEGSLESANSVKATNVLLPSGALLDVTVSSPNEFNLVCGSGLTVSKIPYTVTKYDGKVAANGDSVLQVASGVTENSADLTFSTTEENVKQATLSGEHKDTLAFSVEVKGGSTSGDTQEPSVIYIGNKAQLLAFAADVNGGNAYAGKTVKLTADIDLNGEEWTPIGSGGKTFNGVFDGQNHVISDVNVNGGNKVGFFGSLYDGSGVKAEIKNLIIRYATIIGNHHGGVIAGSGGSGKITNCQVYDSTVTLTPVKSGDKWDDGDKAGGIVGFMSDGHGNVEGCIVSNVEVSGYRDIGGIVGAATGQSSSPSITGNTVKDTIIMLTNSECESEYNGGSQSSNANSVVGRIAGTGPGIVTVSGNTEENVVIYENVVSYSDGESINAFTENTLVLLDEGTYNGLPSFSVPNLKITIIGAGKDKTTITLGTSKPAANSADLIFNGVKFTRGYEDYVGIQHVNSITYNDCAFEGQYFLYGKETFNNCAFTATDAAKYNVWTYGATEVTFNTCQFTCAGKSVLIYNEGGNGQTANFNGCTFTATAPATGKAAIEVDSSYLSGGKTYTVIIDSTTVANGFDAGSVSGDTLWNVKKDTTEPTTTVEVGDNTVYPTTTP